jgi:hypothetical protein
VSQAIAAVSGGGGRECPGPVRPTRAEPLLADFDDARNTIGIACLVATCLATVGEGQSRPMTPVHGVNTGRVRGADTVSG